MPSLLTDLSVASQLFLRATGRRLKGQQAPAPDLEAFREAMDPLLQGIAPGVIKQTAWLDMPANQPPWTHSGVTVDEGDDVSYFLAGQVFASKALDLQFQPSLQVWCRAGDTGEIFRGTRDSHSFKASQGGPLYFGNYFPSTWQTPQGELTTDTDVYKGNQGLFRILVIVWSERAADGLRALLGTGKEPRLVDELARLEQGDTAPEGWKYLWHVGPAEIFREGHSGDGSTPCIHCRTHKDVGILQHDVDQALTPESEIRWRWCVNKLPSTLREDTLPSHDYLSIAVEFDNGRDITYYWSATLPEGYGYDCPLPNWKGIEYHVVVRSGKQGLGEWLDERRNLYKDYKKYMGEPPPRITRVWFIANSIFQRIEGSCDYADIHLEGAKGSVRLL
ncbi:DUF3047 domain-containing protein [Congregibacter litoralis]|uniref:DUF3047 domain-containing protein n=1 Tax=Congregibacter litoralis KT71 TaxID=314285 RepID=A4A8W9_9GAMM|nr:DUF3047 domain-containing protein [Congregibacter litoralis]EAQ97511.1 hypothetical protein KT71_04360 [Congregibacter litoralis KT71]